MELSEIIDSVDIYEYVSQYCELEKKPDGEYWGLSPLKEENTPSFSLNQEKQRYFDFSSGNGGNVLDFICKYHRCSLTDGIKKLKEFANITDDSEIITPVRLQASSIAKKFRRRETPVRESKAAVLPEDYMDRYEWNEEKLTVWEAEGITFETMKKFGVMYDPFSDRIVYPVRNTDGKIINVCGRTLDPDYKANKIRKYTYFKPLGTLDTIYGLSENMESIAEKKEVILFEGAKSVLIAHGWGIDNCGAVLTSHLNQNQLGILIRLGVRVVFALDAEIDIREDANIMRLIPYTQVEWICNRKNLLDEKDSPVDKGQEVFQMLYERRRRLR